MKKLTILFSILCLAIITQAQTTKTQAQNSIDSLLPSASAVRMTNIRQAFTKALNYTQNSVSATSRVVPVIVIIGESNAGGTALNTNATTEELLPRSSVKILNNTSLLFEDLNIGTNNLLGHAGLTNGTTHGLELGLANSVESGDWGTNSVYLIKTGQGGSVISQWGSSDTYFTAFLARINAAKALLKAAGKIPLFYVWHSHGINDAIANTNGSTWKAGTIDLFRRIRQELGFVPILTTRLMEPTYTTYNTFLDSLTSDNFVYAINTTGAGLKDVNHWNYAGMKLIASRMVQTCTSDIGTYEQYTLTQNYKLSTRTLTSVQGGGGTGGGGIGNGTPLTWGGFVNTNEVSNYLTYTSGSAPVGAKTIQTIDATQDFTLIIDLFSTTETNGVVTYLDDDGSTDYTWSGLNPFVSGCYHAADAFYVGTANGSTTNTGVTISSYPAKIKARKSGNNVVYEISTDGGTSYTLAYTHTDVLAGKTTLYVKSTFAVPTAGNRIKVSKL